MQVPTNYPVRVKALREANKLTQTQLAQKLGVSFASVNRWENSQATPSPLAWEQLLKLEESLKPPAQPYSILATCGCCKGVGTLKHPNLTLRAKGEKQVCPYCLGEGKRKEKAPHPSHNMTQFRAEILAPCGTPRFYSVRKCRNCGEEEAKHAAGHFLGFPCKGKNE